ncbi:Homeodomain-like protein, partial [Obelidium mucronatum]
SLSASFSIIKTRMYAHDFNQTQFRDFLLSTPPQEFNTLLAEQQRNMKHELPILLTAVDMASHSDVNNGGSMLSQSTMPFNSYSFMEMMNSNNIAPLQSQFSQPQYTSMIPMSATTSPILHQKEKKMRFRATDQELAFLLKIFESNPFPSTKFRAQIAAKMNLTERQVLFWFQNRRATLKTNGIVAVKPKRAVMSSMDGGGVSGAGAAAAAAFMLKGKQCSLSPLSAENPFFYVASAVDGSSLGGGIEETGGDEPLEDDEN